MTYLWRDNRAKADDAYSNYLSSTDTESVSGYRNDLADYDEAAGNYKILALSTGAIGVALTGIGMYLLLSKPDLIEVGNSSAGISAPRYIPWASVNSYGSLVYGWSCRF